jgi:hypothetical protein
MKLIAQVLVYNEGDYLKQAVEPWVRVCESIDILEGAFQTTVNLGYPKRSTDLTIDVARGLQLVYNNVTLKHHNDWNEPILRNNHLFETVKKYGRDDTCLFILDGDEVYTEEEVKKCVEQVNSQWEQYNRWWVYMKNYIGERDYYEGFHVPRFAKLKNALGFDSYNGLAYSDGVKETDIAGVCPKHISWWPLDKAARKIEWQTKALGWTCSFKVEDGKVVLNDEYYQQMNKARPRIYHE